MKFIRTWGWLFGLIATLAAVSMYVYSARALTSMATDVLSPANSRSETALTLDTKIYALARTTRELRTEIRASFIKKSTLVRVFEYLENIRKTTGVSLKVLGISESVPAPKKRVRKNSVVEDDAPTEQKAAASGGDAPALPQPKGLGSVTVTLEVRGSHTAVIDTIRLVEMLPVVGNLQSVSVRTRDSGRSGEGEWIGNISLYLPTLAEISVEKK